MSDAERFIKVCLPSHHVTATLRREIASFIEACTGYRTASLPYRMNTADEFCLGRTHGGQLVAVMLFQLIEEQIGKTNHLVLLATTILVDPAYRGRGLGSWLILSAYARMRRLYPDAKLHWAFAANREEAYVQLTRSMVLYWPHPHLPTPASAKHLMDAAGQHLPKYNANMGLARYDIVPNDASWSTDLDDPKARFFRRRNPSWREGCALLCLCPLTLENMTDRARTRLSRRL
ncbi:MAG: GNAT family N-acetyltransferase [Myxococcota bacterium]